MKVISLGWGVQSFTLAAMAALGELEPVDAAVHADTTHEGKRTYEFADRWRGWLEERGVRVVTVVNKDPVRIVYKSGIVGVDIPAFTLDVSGHKGQIRRQCTEGWKIANIHRWLQQNRNKNRVEQWIGISMDEYLRMKESRVQYITNRWPLIDKHMTREDCKKWLTSHGLEVPPKSACTFCPFRNQEEWRSMSQVPEDWAEAVAVDRDIREAWPNYKFFVHPSRKPIDEVDFRTAEEKGQLHLWDEECYGVCGV